MRMCHREPFGGKIVKREFDDTGVRVSQFVVELSDGTREGVNVSPPPELPLVTRDNIIVGLQKSTLASAASCTAPSTGAGRQGAFSISTPFSNSYRAVN